MFTLFGVNRNTVRVAVIAIVAVALARFATTRVPALSRFQGTV